MLFAFFNIMKITDKTISLKLNTDFRRVYRRGKSVAGGYVVVYAMPNKRQLNRLGLSVSTSVGKAVVRNRIKRIMRESWRDLDAKIPAGFDFVIIARTRAVQKTKEQIERDMGFCLKSLNLT